MYRESVLSIPFELEFCYGKEKQSMAWQSQNGQTYSSDYEAALEAFLILGDDDLLAIGHGITASNQTEEQLEQELEVYEDPSPTRTLRTNYPDIALAQTESHSGLSGPALVQPIRPSSTPTETAMHRIAMHNCNDDAMSMPDTLDRTYSAMEERAERYQPAARSREEILRRFREKRLRRVYNRKLYSSMARDHSLRRNFTKKIGRKMKRSTSANSKRSNISSASSSDLVGDVMAYSTTEQNIFQSSDS